MRKFRNWLNKKSQSMVIGEYDLLTSKNIENKVKEII